MVVPFGFSVGDFVVIGKLIGQIAVELRENGEAEPEYQSLLIELEALDRALRKLQGLKPAKHELIHLTSIRATAVACERPLQNFLDKISKFDGRLGSFGAANNKWNGLGRRIQFRVMFKEDITQLRSALASHVTTINMLLMTQTIASISTAEEDRHQLASSLELQIAAHRRLLGDVDDKVTASLRRQDKMDTRMRNQTSAIHEIQKATEQTRQHFGHQESKLHHIQAVTDCTHEQNKSILLVMTEILSAASLGLMQFEQIAQKLHTMIQVCLTFTREMRATMGELVQLFCSLHAMLQRMHDCLPTKLNLPIVQFTTALGDKMALPFQLCQQWVTFKELLQVIFQDKPGRLRVEQGKYLIMNARGGRRLDESFWQHAVKQDDHLSMSIALDDLAAKPGICPFPTCQASTEGAAIENGGCTCPMCGRWSLLSPLSLTLDSLSLEGLKLNGMNEEATGGKGDSKSDLTSGDKEDIELYRLVHAWYLSEDSRCSATLASTVLSDSASLEKGQPNINDAPGYLNRVQRHYRDEPGTCKHVHDMMNDYEDVEFYTADVMFEEMLLLNHDPSLSKNSTHCYEQTALSWRDLVAS